METARGKKHDMTYTIHYGNKFYDLNIIIYISERWATSYFQYICESLHLTQKTSLYFPQKFWCFWLRCKLSHLSSVVTTVTKRILFGRLNSCIASAYMIFERFDIFLTKLIILPTLDVDWYRFWSMHHHLLSLHV